MDRSRASIVALLVGANMLEYQDDIGGIGPIASKCPGAGKLLMQAVMKAAAEHGVRAVRLNAVIANTRSFSLYLRLGFEPRRTCIEYVGCCTAEAPAGFVVKPLAASDVEECSALHEQVRSGKQPPFHAQPAHVSSARELTSPEHRAGVRVPADGRHRFRGGGAAS